TRKCIFLDLAMHISEARQKAKGKTQKAKRKSYFCLLTFAFCLLTCRQQVWAGVIVSNPSILSVGMTTMTVNWASTNTATGFEVDASTDPNFTGVLFSSITADGAATTLSVGLGGPPLAPNTTYYAQVGGISGGTTSYINTVPTGMSTLAS